MLILASGSPRRHQILLDARIPHEVRVPAHVDETLLPGEDPIAAATRLARQKAFALPIASDECILGADTMVVVDSIVLNKPEDDADAIRMLKLLAGRWHEVVTGVCIRTAAGAVEAVCRTRVHFVPMSDAEISAYVETGEPMDKAGAYGIQGAASCFIDSIEGCYFNVVGLPISLVWRMLVSCGGV